MYVLVLAISTIVVILGLSAIAVERTRSRLVTRETDYEAAQILAVSAIEHALHTIEITSESDPSWRLTLRDVVTSLPVADGTIEWRLRDPRGGDASTDPTKAIHVVGTGLQGDAVHTLRVIVRPSGPAFNSLAVPMHAGNKIVLATGTVMQADGPITSNTDIESTAASVFPPVEAAGEIEGGTYFNTAVPFAERRGMPGGDVVDYYLDNGTVIDGALLPVVFDDLFLERVVLSPRNNPWGDTNPEGIYVVDCHGDNLVIRDARIVGTVVFKNSGSNNRITGSVHWAPAVQNFPAFLVERDDTPLLIDLSSDDLSEAAVGTNFNPIGTPYDSGEDATLDDVYPTRIHGLLFSKSDLRFGAGHHRIEGIVLGKRKIRTDPYAVVELTYVPSIAEDPPPGFFVPDGKVRIGAFSWARTDR